MSPEQREELLERVGELVGEHCHGFVFIAEVEADEYVEGLEESQMIWCYDGSMTMTTGMLRRASLELEGFIQRGRE